MLRIGFSLHRDITEDTIAAITERYRPQVEAYANAMARIYEKPVKKTMLIGS